MARSEDEIEARLADLRRQRDALDREIADHVLYLELGRRLRGTAAIDATPAAPAAASPGMPLEGPSRASSAEPAPPSPPPAATRSVASERYVASERQAKPPEPVAFEADPVGARRYGRALVEAAVAVLVRAGRPMHAGEILEALVAQGFTVPGQDPVAALNTRLWKRSGLNGPLRRLGDAVYAPAGAGDGPRA